MGHLFREKEREGRNVKKEVIGFVDPMWWYWLKTDEDDNTEVLKITIKRYNKPTKRKIHLVWKRDKVLFFFIVFFNENKVVFFLFLFDDDDDEGDK